MIASSRLLGSAKSPPRSKSTDAETGPMRNRNRFQLARLRQHQCHGLIIKINESDISTPLPVGPISIALAFSTASKLAKDNNLFSYMFVVLV